MVILYKSDGSFFNDLKTIKENSNALKEFIDEEVAITDEDDNDLDDLNYLLASFLIKSRFWGGHLH